MITKDNITEILKSLRPNEIEEAINDDGDYIGVWLNIFNAGCYVSIESLHYNDEIESDYANYGMLFCDKDDFIRLLEENEIEYEF